MTASTRSREVIEAAQLAATTGGNTNTEPVHLLVALLKQEDGTSRSLVQKAGVDPATLAPGTTYAIPPGGAVRVAHEGGDLRALTALPGAEEALS